MYTRIRVYAFILLYIPISFTHGFAKILDFK